MHNLRVTRNELQLSLHKWKLRFMNRLWHELCLTAHYLQLNSWSKARNHGKAKSRCKASIHYYVVGTIVLDCPFIGFLRKGLILSLQIQIKFQHTP